MFLTHFSLYLIHVEIYIKKFRSEYMETHLTCFLQGRKFSCMHDDAHFFTVKYYFVVFIFIFFVFYFFFIYRDARLFQPWWLAYRLYMVK
jgi:hypothetical protein